MPEGQCHSRAPPHGLAIPAGCSSSASPGAPEAHKRSRNSLGNAVPQGATLHMLTCLPAGSRAPPTFHTLRGTALQLSPQPAEVSSVPAGESPLPRHLISLNPSQISPVTLNGKEKSLTVALTKGISLEAEKYESPKASCFKNCPLLAERLHHPSWRWR